MRWRSSPVPRSQSRSKPSRKPRPPRKNPSRKANLCRRRAFSPASPPIPLPSTCRGRGPSRTSFRFDAVTLFREEENLSRLLAHVSFALLPPALRHPGVPQKRSSGELATFRPPPSVSNCSRGLLFWYILRAPSEVLSLTPPRLRTFLPRLYAVAILAGLLLAAS